MHLQPSRIRLLPASSWNKRVHFTGATGVQFTFDEPEEEGSRSRWRSHGFHSLHLQLRSSHDLLRFRKYSVCLNFGFVLVVDHTKESEQQLNIVVVKTAEEEKCCSCRPRIPVPFIHRMSRKHRPFGTHARRFQASCVGCVCFLSFQGCKLIQRRTILEPCTTVDLFLFMHQQQHCGRVRVCFLS